LNVGGLFAGIGGFELGLERAGFEIEWQVELDPYCRAVLERHFPRARRFEDVREVGAANLAPVDLICGGFPCQDLSVAGKGAGIDGVRSGLWAEFARIVRELRPRYVLVENVPALLTGKGKRWDRAPIGRVLGDLAEVGYDAEWSVISAREFGAPHLRKRVWIVAYPREDADAEVLGRGTRRARGSAGLCPDGEGLAAAGIADSPRDVEARAASAAGSQRQRARSGGSPSRARGADSDPHACRLAGVPKLDRETPAGQPETSLGRHAHRLRHPLSDAEGLGGTARRPRCEGEQGAAAGSGGSGGHWAVEPDVGRVADGVPHRVDRLAGLGNALLPQIAEWIGRRILDYEASAMRSTGVQPGVRRRVHPGVRREARPTRPVPRRGADSAARRKLRSLRHQEAHS
jgi:DNA (cytosine-5)-methyltransferase 1